MKLPRGARRKSLDYQHLNGTYGRKKRDVRKEDKLLDLRHVPQLQPRKHSVTWNVPLMAKAFGHKVRPIQSVLPLVCVHGCGVITLLLHPEKSKNDGCGVWNSTTVDWELVPNQTQKAMNHYVTRFERHRSSISMPCVRLIISLLRMHSYG